MPKQSRLAGFLGLEPYNAKDSDAQDSNTADTAPEEPRSHEQSGRPSSSTTSVDSSAIE